jgi:hypothetical protein
MLGPIFWSRTTMFRIVIGGVAAIALGIAGGRMFATATSVSAPPKTAPIVVSPRWQPAGPSRADNAPPPAWTAADQPMPAPRVRTVEAPAPAPVAAPAPRSKSTPAVATRSGKRSKTARRRDDDDDD